MSASHLELVAVALLFVAAVPATVFPFAYAWIARGVWWRVPSGRALIVSTVALAMLLDYEVVEMVVEFDDRASLYVVVATLGLIAAGAWLMLGALAYEYRRQGRSSTPPTRGA